MVRGLLVVLLVACTRSAETPDAGLAPTIDGSPGPIHVDDGVPTRRPCTSQFGSAVTSAFGRLDGRLVAIVPPGGSACNADSDHVHLQIEASGAIYDVAVNVGSSSMMDVHTSVVDFTLPAVLPWAEGWHVGGSVYYTLMGVKSVDIPLRTRAQLVSELMTDLANVNHVSIYAIGYGPEGAHLVHRNGSGRDGLLITQPLSTPARGRVFSFTTQTF